MADPSEVAKRIQSIVTTLEQKKNDMVRAQAAMNTLRLTMEQAQKALDQTRRQLVVELEKMDPQMFEHLSDDFILSRPISTPPRPAVSVPAP